MKGLPRTFLRLAPLFAVRIVAMGLIFVQTLAMTRAFGAEVYGMLAFAQTAGAMALLLACFGYDKLLMRRLARTGLDAVAADPGWRVTLRFCLTMAGALSITLAALGLAAFWVADLGAAYGVPLIGAAALIPLMTLRQITEALILGTRRTVRSIMGSQIVFPLAMICGAAAAWLATDGAPGIAEATWVYVVAATLSALAAVSLLRPIIGRLRSAPGPEAPVAGDIAAAPGSGDVANAPVAGVATITPVASDIPARRTILTSGASFALVTAGFMLGPNMDVLLVGLLAGPEQVAIVRVSARLAEAIGLIRAIAMMQYAPLLAAAHGAGDNARLRRLVRELGLIFVVTGAPLFAAAMAFAPQAMGVFGADFVVGAPVMQIYIVGVLFTMLAGPGSTLLSMCGHEGLTARILWGALAINLALDLILIPIYGAVGCAIANATSLVALGLVSAVMAVRTLGIQPSALLTLGRRAL
jgi:O-antigen/teichoic acid export membrane protein